MSVDSFIGLAPEANDIMPISSYNLQVRICNLHVATFTLQVAKLIIHCSIDIFFMERHFI
jgi:hypothetical protein